ncbi:MAG: FAD-dependent oxidoreductase [Oscillospiraceae bacterium]|nr:FAD-dependent oxidoreductase [Oscillospiraceae bacterium]
MMQDHSILFQPIQIGPMTVKNRIVMAPMGTNFGKTDGLVRQEAVRYYTRRAKGGVGLIMTEAMYVHPSGAHRPGAMAIDSDDKLEGIRALTYSVHEAGGKIASQLTHAGRVVGGAIRPKGYEQSWGPSALVHRKTGELSHAMTLEEIQEVIEAFGQAAVRAKKGGFDAVEIHGTHGYLLMQFMSPLWNKREDAYGGSLENRMRFPLEVTKRILDAVGPDYPVIYRMAGSEQMPGGMTVDDAMALARELEKLGVSAFHVSGGINETPADMSRSIATNYSPEGYFVPYAQRLKQEVSVPVIVVGRLGDPDLAAQVVMDGKADMICMGRQLLADPEWPEKVRTGRDEDIVRCISCNRGCIEELCLQHSITCVQNPFLGHECTPIVPVERKKKVLVAGAGLAGLEFAVQAALRGHHVDVMEKDAQPGGQCSLAALPPHKGDFQRLVDSRLHKLERLGVSLRCGVTVTAETAAGYDFVAVCTGGEQRSLPFPWVQQPIVAPAYSILRRERPHPAPGQSALVIGGGAVGLETAHMLADEGVKVHVVELAETVGNGFVPTAWAAMKADLDRLGVEIYTSTHVTDLQEGKAFLAAKDREPWAIEDLSLVVQAVGIAPDKDLYAALVAAGIPCVSLGSCNGAGNTLEAVRQGYEAGVIL